VNGPEFLQALEVVDALVVDSATFERPFDSTLELAGLASVAAGRRIVLGDLQWGRLLGWRELLAQLFTPVPRRRLLTGITGFGIDYVGEGRGNRVAAALLAGWLADALGWKLQRAAAGSGGLVIAYYQAHGHPVEVNFRSVSAADLGPGELSAVRIEAAAGGHTAAIAIERDPDRRSRVRVGIEVGEAERLEETRPMDSPGETALLVDLIGQKRDAVYLGALAQTATLLRAFL
jgi:glucose-6-phosphate dehydrogenase assembly protein OpcA